MTLYDDAVTVLSSWKPPTSDQNRLQVAYLAHLEQHLDGLTRECHPDHITASTLVVSSDLDRVLLNLHGKYGIWVQFGGHCEAGDATLANAALREAVEESGITQLRLVSPVPTQLSTHEVMCGPIRPAHHLDVRYVAVAPAGAVAVPSSESQAVCWFERDELPDGVDDPLQELIDASRQG